MRALEKSEPERALQRAEHFRGQSGYAINYRDLPIFAAPGLHELAAERLATVLAPAGARVLELGAGAGAMSLRLKDRGYAVTASDLNERSFVPTREIPFVALDLNEAFAQRLQRRFDAIVALELVEHLENPCHFFRQCREALENKGFLLVSTPNLANPVSQAMFATRGHFQWFNDNDYHEQGHIMPLSPGVLRRCWTEAGFVCRWQGSVGDPLRMLDRKRDRRLRWISKLLAAVSATPDALRGEVYLAVLQVGGLDGDDSP
ncbi:class I SAM-dependent methyltransferase [Lysobacter sp. A6]|uniref:Class I SAM-dependent methyltransferase n=1 Tax=Noviluteimonas lactosilytica TaxID=2888523 RepID=A0ABS8JKW2_9GAMM|nr:class I SAM-dependent methyltransferase [Lysobacter lactosilyticus]MCC8364253.1 class I SAM-dependent methyltransferase [Lysobacter lactosilyticus]